RLSQSQSNLSCPECCVQMLSSRMYHKHMSQVHPHLLDFVCSICGKGMRSKASLNLHMATHGSRNFVCHVCNFKFKMKHHLRDHLSTKHGLFHCRGCSGVFPKG
ncbi:hypothetical protein EGW08_010706, partial [Elysia chlorotica]